MVSPSLIILGAALNRWDTFGGTQAVPPFGRVIVVHGWRSIGVSSVLAAHAGVGSKARDNSNGVNFI